EPPNVRNYLELVKKMAPGHIYINALPQGNYWGPWSPGRGGTKEPVPSTLYVESLRDSYALRAEYDTDYFLKTNEYRSYVFERIV
ncbi:MAG TPA: hypothetical protein VLX12_05410, partial [Syntrophorhabdales bacterium]|nr:hypothetical protein [Syntrophorhabdales bacterium]